MSTGSFAFVGDDGGNQVWWDTRSKMNLFVYSLSCANIIVWSKNKNQKFYY